MPLELSYTNKAATATVTVNNEDTNYPKENARDPLRPMLPSKVTVATDTGWVFDFGSAQSIAIVGVVRPNFTTVHIQGNAVNSGWDTPSYTSGALTVRRNPWNWRYQIVHLPVSFTYQYLRVYAPTQTPTEGSVFLLGGVWAGVKSQSPENLLIEAKFRTVIPRIDVNATDGAFTQRLLTGHPRVEIEASLRTVVSKTAPAVGDTLETWQGLIRQMMDVDPFFLYFNLGDSSQGWPVRLFDSPEWDLQGGTGIMQWRLQEVIGP